MIYSIFLVGTGGTGSNLIPNLAQFAISEKRIRSITLIDGDEVESKNFRNQKFTQREVGMNKARVLARRYSKLDININFVDSYIKDEDTLVNMIKDSVTEGVLPILIGAVDNNNCRIILDKVFRNDLIPDLIYIDTGNGDIERDGQTVVGIKQGNKIIAPPVCDYSPQILEGDREEEMEVQYSCSAKIVDNPQHLTANVMSATTVFLILVNIISYSEVDGTFFAFNAETINLYKVK